MFNFVLLSLSPIYLEELTPICKKETKKQKKKPSKMYVTLIKRETKVKSLKPQIFSTTPNVQSAEFQGIPF